MSNQEKPIDTNVSHKKHITYDEFFFKVVELCSKTGATPFAVVQAMVLEKIQEKDFRVYLSGSAFTSITNNGVSFLIEKILKVDFGKNEKLIIGTALHAGIAELYEMARNGRNLNLERPFSKIVQSVEEEYPFIKPDLLEEWPKEKIIDECLNLFEVFYKGTAETIEAEKILYIEEFLNLKTPTELLSNPSLSKQIVLCGTPDLIEYDKENKILYITDFKSSAKPISGKVDVDPKLEENMSKLKTINSSLVKLNKEIEKYKKAEDEIERLEKEINEAKVNNKTHKRLDTSLEKWKKHFEEYKNNCVQKKGFEDEIEFLEKTVKPLKSEYEEEKAKADLIACKNSHADQVNFYALLFALSRGHEFEIKEIRFRIKNIVKSQNPFMQEFEWGLTQRESQRAEELYTSAIETIEALIDVKVKPMALFKRAAHSYIGDNTNKFFDEVENELMRLEQEQQTNNK